MIVEYKGRIETIPVTCFQRMDPTTFLPIERKEILEDELELELERVDPRNYLNAIMNDADQHPKLLAARIQ